jgi:hypothetical protein
LYKIKIEKGERMNKKNITILVSLLACYFGSKLSPWFTNITYYIKHMSVFVFLSFTSYIIIKYVYEYFNNHAKTNNQIKLNGVMRVSIQALLLTVILFAQLRYIERKDTVVNNHCEYYDQFGNMIFESQYYFECPTYSIIENTNNSLMMEFNQKTKDYYFTTYYYNPELSLDEESNTILGNMNFELLTTISITYNDEGYIINSETIHSLVANNHKTKQSVLTTKKIILNNTYNDGLYTSLKTTTTGFDMNYQYQEKPIHLSLEDSPKYYEYTYSTLNKQDDFDQIEVYTYLSDELGNPLTNNTQELILSSKVYKEDDKVNIRIDSSDYFDTDILVENNYISHTYKVLDMNVVFDWEDVGNIPLLKKDRIYDDIGDIDYKVIDRHSITQVTENGNKVSFFNDYSNVYNQYPSIITKTEFGYMREDYYAYNQNYFLTEKENIDEPWETLFLMRFNLYTIDEIYEIEQYFDVNDSTTIYQKIPYFYSYY